MIVGDCKDIWVFVEYSFDRIKGVSLELIGKARACADILGEDVAAVLIGKDVKKHTRSLIQSGADKVYVVEDDLYENYSTEGYTKAIVVLAEKYKPNVVFLGATTLGRDLGPRVACRLKTGLTADCTGIEVDAEQGLIRWIRPALGGNIMAEILCPTARPQMGTVRANVMPKPELNKNRTGEVISETITIVADEIRTKVLEVIREEGAEDVDLEGADFIVSGGRGIRGPEGFGVVKKLAKVLDGELGASRAAVDSGWIGHAHQIGQTGKTVKPKIYIALGISGQIQHIAGMSSADYIIAVNKDPDAPIFDIAHIGIVGDLFEIAPKLADRIANLDEG